MVRTRTKKSAAAPVAKRIVQRDGEWCVLSEDGARSFGCYPTEAAAQARLAQVEAFKAVGALSLLEGSSGGLPPVLTAKAVAREVMPPLGESALPRSLESGIPPELRYWTAKSAEEARAVRDELVERSVVEPDDILVVDGEPRVVVWRAFLAVHDEPTATELSKRTPVAVAGGLCLIDGAGPGVAVDATGDPTPWSVERVQKALADYGSRVCLALSDTPENRAALSGLASTFVLETRPGVVFGSQLPLAKRAPHAASLSVKSHGVRLIRKDVGAEERFVLGVVLEPDVVDSQNDTYNAAEVRKTAHAFMEKYQQLGKQHSEIVTGKLKVLESYLAPVDFAVGAETVKAGTWVLGIRVVDDELWGQVKDGSFTGFSIGGSAIRSPITET